MIGVLREREVAEQHLHDKDYRKWEHLFRDLEIELKQASSSDATRSIRQPPCKGIYSRLLIASKGSSLWRGGLGRRHSGTEAYEM